MKKENILGFDICITNYNELINNLFKDFDNNIANFVVNINPQIIMNNYKSKKTIQCFNSENYQSPDGIGILYASRIKKGNIINRITGIDLMNCICRESSYHNSKIFLYGGKSGIAVKAKKELETLYPNINIVGTSNGYVSENIALDKIKKSNCNILFVGLGSPKQEKFIMKNKDTLKNVKLFIPVGGSFDVISKSIKRAPDWFINHNLEWFYRALREPKRLAKHFLLIKFIFLILANKKTGE